MTQERQPIEELYKIGYACGYAWLTRGWNFLHPNSTFTYQNGCILHGYIPGGPLFFPNNARDNYPHIARKAWVNGWIDGINTYVQDIELDYSVIKNID